GPDRVIEEDRMDRLAHRIVAAEAEADVGNAARHLRMRQVLLDPTRCRNEVDGVVVVLLDTGRDGEDIRIDHDIFGWEANLVDESIIRGTRAMSGSAAMRFRKRVIAAFESSIASSMLTSINCAPFCTCERATSTAPTKSPARISLEKTLEPVTFVRSPTLTNSE